MASHLPSPPESPASSHSDNETRERERTYGEEADASLSEQLDTLLEAYLSFLDQYTKLCAQLSKDLSAGFFALAQANRNANSTLGAGRRYGEEGFDERMKAGMLVNIKLNGDDGGVQSEIFTTEHEESHNEREESGLSTESGSDSTPPQSTGTTPPVASAAERGTKPLEQGQEQHEQSSRDEVRQIHDENTHAPSTSKYNVSVLCSANTTKDPLRWYGILVPPALRTAKSTFLQAVSSDIPSLINVMNSMRALEDQIWSLRRDLDILDDYKTGIQEVEDGYTEETKQLAASVQPDPILPVKGPQLSYRSARTASTSKKTHVLSASPPASGLPTEPRSRVLKLG
jgi:coiled-coil domain-containing protein 115